MTVYLDGLFYHFVGVYICLIIFNYNSLVLLAELPLNVRHLVTKEFHIVIEVKFYVVLLRICKFDFSFLSFRFVSLSALWSHIDYLLDSLLDNAALN